MKFSIRSYASITIPALTALFAFSVVAHGQDKETKELFDAKWQRLIQVDSGFDVVDKNNFHDHWALIAKECNQIFNELARHEKSNVLMKMFVQKFGKDGPTADMRWMLAFHELLLINDRRLDNSPSAIELQNNLARCQVEAWLEDRDSFDRHYRLSVWARGLIGRRDDGNLFLIVASTTNKNLRKQDNNLRWLDIRNAMFLFKATSRDDRPVVEKTR